MKGNSIKVDYLARVEGEGSLIARFRGGQLKAVQFKICEPPRFFEAFLRGRSYREAPDITARICGICPVAYQMSATHAMEDAFGVRIGGPIRDLRRLIYCGEWIESHVLHIALLHAPDFLGYEDAIQMARDHPEIVQTALKLKKVGNDLVTLIGGREIHPIKVRVGGFYKVPRRRDLGEIEERMKWARDAAVQLAKGNGRLPFPAFERDSALVALHHPGEYPFNEGRLVSNRGLDIAIDEFETYIVEEHVPHSNALHSRIVGRGDYLVRPLARFNLNFDRLSSLAQDVAKEVGVAPPCRNPFQSIVVRAIETVYACDEALRLIANYTPPDKPAVEVQPYAATGHGCTEAPRGILYHRYRVDEYGTILDARIVPPTAQNQKSIEADLWELIQANAELPQEQLQWRCEQAIRNYDPCISCATHFLRLQVERE